MTRCVIRAARNAHSAVNIASRASAGVTLEGCGEPALRGIADPARASLMRKDGP